MFHQSIQAILVTLLWRVMTTVAVPYYDGQIVTYENMEVVWPTEDCPDESIPYCFSKGNHYPQEAVDKVAENLEKMMIQDTELLRFVQYSYRSGESSGILLEQEEDGTPDCPTTYTNQSIYYVATEQGDPKVVIQSQKFHQIFDIRRCLYPGEITRRTDNFDSNTGKVAACEDTYQEYNFLVLSEDRKEFEILPVNIPVCCACRLV